MLASIERGEGRGRRGAFDIYRYSSILFYSHPKGYFIPVFMCQNTCQSFAINQVFGCLLQNFTQCNEFRAYYSKLKQIRLSSHQL